MKPNTTKDDTKAEHVDAAHTDADKTSHPPVAVQVHHELEAEHIINSDMLLAMGVGVVPIPFVDFLGVTAVQLRMLRRLAELYKTPFSKSDTHALVSALVGSALPAYSALPVASVVRWIPVIGWTLGTASMAILSGASTYALGKVFTQHFESGGTIKSFDVGTAKDEFLAFLHIGKQKAASKSKDKVVSGMDAAEAATSG